MTIERLTEDERVDLSNGDVSDGPKVLRIIDAQTIELERLRTSFTACEVARLTEALAEAESERDEYYSAGLRQAIKTEAECAALRAELEQKTALLDMCSANFDRMIEEQARADSAESSLAAATALLRWCRRDWFALSSDNGKALLAALDTFLAAQPAAPVVKCPAFCQCPAHQPAAPEKPNV